MSQSAFSSSVSLYPSYLTAFLMTAYLHLLVQKRSYWGLEGFFVFFFTIALPFASGEFPTSSPDDAPSSSSCSAAVSVFAMFYWFGLLLLRVDVVVEEAFPKEGVVFVRSFDWPFADLEETKVLTAWSPKNASPSVLPIPPPFTPWEVLGLYIAFEIAFLTEVVAMGSSYIYGDIFINYL